MKKRFPLILLSSLLISTAAYGRASAPSDSQKWTLARLNKVWCSSDRNEDPEKFTEITFGVADDGKIYNPEILRYTGDCQFDAECLEAVSCISPVLAPNKGDAFLDKRIVFFRTKESKERRWLDVSKSYDGADIREYLKTHPQPDNIFKAFVVVHRIPLDVLNRYPGMFTKDELMNVHNLVEIPTGVGRRSFDNKLKTWGNPLWFCHAIPNLYSHWSTFLSNPKITKEKILDFAKGCEIYAW